RAVREYRLEHDRDLRVVALHGDDDAGNLWVREADEAVLVEGRGWADAAAVERALVATAVDAVWDGTSSVDARPGLAECCARLGIRRIGAAALPQPSPPTSESHIAERTTARRIAVHAIVDGDGTAMVVGLCEDREPIESAQLTPAVDWGLRDEARQVLAGATGPGACSVMFQVGADGAWSFAGVRPGLDAGHAVTEMTTGIDLVKLQLHVADGGRFDEPVPEANGHAIAVHLHAEDAERHLPLAAGRVAMLRLPGGPGVRIDRGAAEGDIVTRSAGAAIATLTAWGRDRDEAVARLRRALAETVVVIEGGATNRGVLLDRLSTDSTTSATLEEPPDAVLAMLVAAIDCYDRELMGDHASFFAWGRRGRPQAASDISRRVELRHRGVRYLLHVSHTGPISYRIRLGDAHVDVDLRRTGQFESRLAIAGRDCRVVSSTAGTHHAVEVDGGAHHFVRDDGSIVRAPVPGVVVSVCVAPGDQVEVGDAVAVVESMKLETIVGAVTAGRVREVLVSTNAQVPAGAVLVRLEEEPDAPTASASALRLPATVPRPVGTPAERCAANVLTLSNLLLGYDIAPADARAAADDEADVYLALGADPDVLRREINLVKLFADLQVLFRMRHDLADDEERVRSPQEHFFAYLRSLDVVREGLPSRFVADLRRALAHYGVQSLDRGPSLQGALYRIFQSHQRVAMQLPVLVAVLERWLHAVEPLTDTSGDALRECLDHLVAATVHAHPVIADLAREVQYHQFDKPVLARASQAELATMEQHLAALGASADDTARADHVNALVACPQPLAPVLVGRMSKLTEAEQRVALEVMTRRYYRMRKLGGIEGVDGTESPMLHGTYDDADGIRVHVLTATGSIDDLDGMVADAALSASGTAADQTVVVDLYTWSAAPLGDAD
ncbi:MAG TPA: biotin/lipoyl-containing protein, partial [Ilumatobacteraceae bacterium]|nr:biotin/lipoyl-containing protein [Ilumatobacteraceae bacterium]